jgi:hypothetical protein
MTSPASLPRMHPNWGKRIALTLGCVVIAGLLVGFVIFRMVKCEDIDEPSVRSPDGKWVVESTTRACPVGLLSVTDYSDIVTLSASPTAAWATAASVLIFESDDSAKPPTVTWTSANVMVLKLNEVGAVRVSKHEFADVTINYVVPKWMWDKLGKIETDRLRQDTKAEELHKAGKMSSDMLRTELQINQNFAEEWTRFRQWVSENASHDSDPANGTPSPK